SLASLAVVNQTAAPSAAVSASVSAAGEWIWERRRRRPGAGAGFLLFERQFPRRAQFAFGDLHRRLHRVAHFISTLLSLHNGIRKSRGRLPPSLMFLS